MRNVWTRKNSIGRESVRPSIPPERARGASAPLTSIFHGSRLAVATQLPMPGSPQERASRKGKGHLSIGLAHSRVVFPINPTSPQFPPERVLQRTMSR
jgi:hypothetical protein